MTTAQPEIKKARAFSPIWIIPLLAAVLGVWMIVHTWMTEGPEIMVSFKTAEGLAAGKTKIKYRNVDIGTVQEVILTEDLEGVIAKIKMERQAVPMLRDDSRLWLVTARVGMGNISGLGTLLSGAYIQLAPGEGKIGQRRYIALETPPLTPIGAPGLRLKLLGDKAGSVSTGDAVVFKGYKIGRIENSSFDTDRRAMSYTVFIDAPYHELIDSSVRFYNVSGISVSAGAEGLHISTGSMDTVLLGGVSFGTPSGMPRGEPVDHNAEFKLYRSQDASEETPFRFGTYYVVRFSQSLKGLLPGAPVEYRGIPVGRVVRVMVKDMMIDSMPGDPMMEGTGVPIPVLIYIEPGRFEMPDSKDSVDRLRNAVATGVPNGIRATMGSGNLLTGAKYIGLDYFPVDERIEMGRWGQYDEIPTIAGGVDQIMVKVNALLDKFDALPLENTLENADDAISQLEKTLVGLRLLLEQENTQALPGELRQTLGELRATLDGFSPDSPMYQNLNNTLQQLNRTLGNVESLTRTLSEQPNAAIMPSNIPPDPIPEARR